MAILFFISVFVNPDFKRQDFIINFYFLLTRVILLGAEGAKIKTLR